MIVVEYRRTMAGAKQIVGEKKSTPRRDRLIAFYRKEERAREAERHRQDLIEKSPVGIAILPHTPPPAIIEQVAFWHGMTPADVVADSRKVPVIEARFDAIAAVAVNCRIAGRPPTLDALGRFFKRHHTSIYQALRQRGLA